MKRNIYIDLVLLFTTLMLLIILSLVISGCESNKEELKYFKATYGVTDGGTLSGVWEQEVIEGENATRVVALPAAGYEFLKWSDNESTNPERTDIGITEDILAIAIFKAKNCSVQYEISGNGTIVGDLNQIVSYGDDATSVTAIPNEGYSFVGWSDNESTNPERTDIGITEDVLAIAIFKAKNCSVQYEVSGNGTIVGDLYQIVTYGGTATTVTAIPNEGYKFVEWSDNKSTNPTRTDKIIISDLKIYAIFEQITFKVTYCSQGSGNGVFRTLDGKTLYWKMVQEVEYGGNTQKVTVTSLDPKYTVTGWSDGYELSERQEINVRSDITVYVNIGIQLKYVVDGNKGGKIVGNCTQILENGNDSESVSAVADEGFVFVGWSDMTFGSVRIDKDVERSWEYIAYFEPIEKKFNYNYGKGFSMPLQLDVTINRDNLNKLQFIVPEMSGYTFCGWYADPEYKIKVVNEYGKLMLGYNTFTLDTDNIYAKWKIDDKTITYKVLTVMIDEVNAELKSSVINDYVTVKYKMSPMERKILSLIPGIVQECINEWFEGKVTFEFDTYFTTVPLNSENITSGYNGDKVSYSIYAYNISEIGYLLKDYHSVIDLVSMSDYNQLLHNGGGAAGNKYGMLHIEEILRSAIINNIPLQTYYEELLKETNIYHEIAILESYMHEFTHTIEKSYSMDGIYEFHLIPNGLEANKQYLLGKLDVGKDGLVGIPIEYWLHEVEVSVNYVPNVVNGYIAGKVIELGIENNKYTYVLKDVSYGSEMIVEAIPYEGYKFFKWSDGVTTAVRHDINIISYLNVTAIFCEAN